MHRPAPHAASVLAENQNTYDVLMRIVRRYAEAGDTEQVLRCATWAAAFAWMAPVGLLSDLELERTVVHAVRGSDPVVVDPDRRSGRVLHVLSEGYPTGGHTRLVARWIGRDHRRADVALTHQLKPIPEWLRTAVTDAGGELHDLAAGGTELLARAVALRTLMDAADLVVLHVHPFDVVSLAAVNLPGVRPPVIVENHADLSFWVGLGSADLVCELRPETAPFDVALRGVPAHRIGVLPMPLEPVPAAGGAEVRAALGISPDAVVALTVADDWKVNAGWGRGLHDLVDRLLRWSPDLVVVLVGVAPNAAWAKLASRHPGRAISTGRVDRTPPFFAAADVYLDSYPVWAGTSPLEAAMAGLPVVAVGDIPEDDPLRLFQTHSPGLSGLDTAATPEQLTAVVRRLVADPARRATAGRAAQEAVQSLHTGPGWDTAMEDLYARARTMTAVDVDQLGDSPRHDRFAARLLSIWAPMGPGSPAPLRLTSFLGPLADARRWGDLMAASQAGDHPTLTFRAEPGWDGHPRWTEQLFELAHEHPHLSVSLPFVDGDLHGERTAHQVVDRLAALGQTIDTCGDLVLEAAPSTEGALVQSMNPTPETLDWLRAVLASPTWRALVRAGGVH